MSDGFLFIDQIVSTEAEGPRCSRKESILKRITLILAIILGIELLYFLCAVPCMPLKSIRVSPINGMQRNELLQSAGISESTSFISMDVKKATQSLLSLPFVESVSISRHFPNSVDIVITERVAVAVSLAKVSGKLVPVYIDKQGVLFKIGGEAIPNLPLVSGLVFDQVVPGMRLPEQLKNFFMSLETIEKSNPVLLHALSELRIQQKAYGGYEIIVYPAQNVGRVKLGSELNEEVLRYMMLVLDVLASKGIQADEIDFRTGTISYRTKEASSG